MNLVFHIIKKDLRRLAWVLLVWAVTGAYLLVYRKVDILQRSLWDNFAIICIITFAALTLALIAAIVQEDGLSEGNESWRTRPIAPWRLLAAKLAVIFPLFVVVPLTVIVIQSSILGRGPAAADMPRILPFICALVLACVAVAACTKDLGRYFLGGVICLFAVPILSTWLESVFPTEQLPKPLGLAIALNLARERAVTSVIGVVSLAVVFNQYFTRRTKVSLVLIAVGLVALTWIVVFWRWPAAI